MDKASIRFERVEPRRGVFYIEALDESLVEHDAALSLVRHVVVHDSRAVNNSLTFFREDLHWDGTRCEVHVSLHELGAFSYTGEHINVQIEARLHVNDALIFDTKIKSIIDLPLAARPPSMSNVQGIIEPLDIYSFLDNFSAVPQRSQVKIVAMASISGLVLLLALAFAAMNQSLGQFVMFAILGFFGGRWVLGLLKDQLRGYLKFEGVPRMAIERGQAVRMDQLVDAKATVSIDEMTLRVVAVNYECGQYRRGTGTNVRTVSFREPVRGIVLYEREITGVVVGDSISAHLRGDVIYFDPIFEHLYPPVSVGASHGIDLVWEIQILHDEFVDHDLAGSSDIFAYRDFLLEDVELDNDGDVIW